MKPVIISVLLLSFLLSIADALECYHCHKRNSDTCEEIKKECAEGDKCITMSENYENNGTFHSIRKGCSSKMPFSCDTKATEKINDVVFFAIKAKCCDTDLCNNKFYEPPEDDQEPNGRTCPSCYEEGTVEECKTDKEFECQGNSDKCTTFYGRVKKPDGKELTYSLKGCLSTTTCNLNLKKLPGFRVLDEKKFECTDNPSKPQNYEKENE